MAREGVLEVSPAVGIPRAELVYRASRAGGPGGQHVNTSSTRIELLWNVLTTSALDPETRTRVAERLAKKLDGEGRLRIVSASSRSQGQNREAAEERLVTIVRGALAVRKTRRATKPTFGSKQARLEEKKKRSEVKRLRHPEED